MGIIVDGIIKNGNIYIKYSELSSIEYKIYKYKIFLFIKNELNKNYIDSNWYRNLFNNDSSIKKEREIIICERICDKNKIIGVIILKKTNNEKKICTLKVDKNFKKNGIGKILIEMGLYWLNNDKPIITINSNNFIEFKNLFSYYGFQLEQVLKNYYKLSEIEYVYNGNLK